MSTPKVTITKTLRTARSTTPLVGSTANACTEVNTPDLTTNVPRILKLNAAEALGGVTGAMTSGAALSVVTDVAKSSAPALGYTGAYAFANVILTLAGTLIMLI